MKLLSHIFFPITVRRNVHIDPNTRYIIAANHESFLDGPLALAGMSWGDIIRISPTMFMTVPSIYYLPFVRPFAYMTGCYPTRRKNHPEDDPIQITTSFISAQRNICIFPEGKRSRSKRLRAHTGIERVIASSPVPVTILLVHIEWDRPHIRPHLSVAYSIYNGSRNAQSILDAIYDS